MNERNERRGYFRIDDVIGLSYEVIEDNPQPEVANEEDENDIFAKALKAIDTELNGATNLVWRENPAIAKALGVINKKISLVAQYCHPRGLELFDAYEEYAANISGSGMSFRSTEELKQGTCLRITAVLKPSNIRLDFSADLVSCERIQEMPIELFLIRVKIAEGEVAAKEQLVQHVVQKQSQNRVEEKQTKEA